MRPARLRCVERGEATKPRRPLGVTVLALFYIVLGSHALMFGAWLAALAPADAPSATLAGLVTNDPGFVRTYGLALVGMALAFFAEGIGLIRGARWARWLPLALVPLHIAGPPFLLGGVVFAALANVYLFGSAQAEAHLTRRPGRGAASQP